VGARKPTPSAPNKAFVRKDAKAWMRAGSTPVPNSILRDEDIPPAEIWAWAWMASHTETFEINGEKLWKANKHLPKNGPRGAYTLIRNLEERGLLRRVHEVSDQGIPYIVYELQPVPVPVEQRTAKPRKPKAKKKPPKDAFAWKSQAKADSRPVGNLGLTSENTDEMAPTSGEGGFPTGRESGADQRKHGHVDGDGEQGAGGVFPDRVFPDRSGESYKEEKNNKKDQPTKLEHASAASEAGQPGNDGRLDSPKVEPPSAADGPDPDGVRLLRSLPHGVGDKLAGHAVTRWSHVVGAALRSGMDERTVIAKLTDDLPTDSVAQRVRIVVGRRLPDLAADVEQAATRAAEREQSAEERANEQIDQWIGLGLAGAQRAADLLGVRFDPEQHRGRDTDAREWLMIERPKILREFIEQHRADLIAKLTSGNAA